MPKRAPFLAQLTSYYACVGTDAFAILIWTCARDSSFGNFGDNLVQCSKSGRQVVRNKSPRRTQKGFGCMHAFLAHQLSLLCLPAYCRRTQFPNKICRCAVCACIHSPQMPSPNLFPSNVGQLFAYGQNRTRGCHCGKYLLKSRVHLTIRFNPSNSDHSPKQLCFSGA